MSMTYKFPDGFLWGSASSALQSEGASNEMYRGETVWDYWHKTEPFRFHNKVGPSHTSSFYDYFEKDVLLMKEAGLNSFRTSISWARLLPDGEKINPDAIVFYRNLFSFLRKHHIRPIVNLYHFDMPLWLYEKGGWENPDAIDHYNFYAMTAFELFSDLIDQWTTFNEPMVPIEMGYLNDKHLPAVYDLKRAFRAGLHTLLAHSLAVKTFRDMNVEGKIGIILNLTPSYPKSKSDEDVQASQWADVLFNRSFLDPVVHGKIPEKLKLMAQKEEITIDVTELDLELIESNTVDFLGVNYYQPRRVQAGVQESHNSTTILDKYFLNYKWPKAKMNEHRGWEIYEKGLYDIAMNIKKNYKNIPWYVAENGMGVEGEEAFESEEGIIQDDYRISFMTNHLKWLNKGIKEGSNCFGYHTWTWIDNWSWLNGYKNRYGFVRLNQMTNERTMKKSGHWFKNLAKKNQL